MNGVKRLDADHLEYKGEMFTRYPQGWRCMARKSPNYTKYLHHILMRDHKYDIAGRHVRFLDGNCHNVDLSNMEWVIHAIIQRKRDVLEFKLSERVCEFCGGVYNPGNRRQRFCSSACRMGAFCKAVPCSKRYRTTRKCTVCGRDFECAKYPLRLTCSKPCQVEQRRQTLEVKRGLA